MSALTCMMFGLCARRVMQGVGRRRLHTPADYQVKQMPSEKHLGIIRKGAGFWNKWRLSNPQILPDLSIANLSRAELKGINLKQVNLQDAQLSGVCLDDADLTGANLRLARISAARLRSTCLNNADLRGARLSYADLSKASLQGALLHYVNLSSAILIGTDFNMARVSNTLFVNVDLSAVKNLDAVIHEGPSSIGIDTLCQSNGNIPEIFLRGAGVTENFILQLPSLTGKLFDCYSCFISYQSNDQSFAERLYADLQSRGVRCWYAPDNLKIGEEIRVGIDKSIHLHDKLLLVLSEHSIKSQWVEQEVETALSRERAQGRIVLFPIRLDDAIMNMNMGWPSLIKNTRHIGDFRGWNDHNTYQKAFLRLVRDLKAEV
jgi:TIR domain/Pentapeptide repeats (8 copies)